jgi:SNF2 family DNA or RNA helicase
MISTAWHIEDNHIELKLACGAMVRPAALEIFQTVFGGAREVGGEKVRSPLEDLPGLTFARQPASPAVQLTWGSAGALIARFGIVVDSGFCALEPAQDQVVHNLRWYPVRLDHVNTAEAWLREVGITRGKPFTVGSLVALRARTERPVSLFDEIDFNPSDSRYINPAAGHIPGFKGELYAYQSSGVSFLAHIADQGVGCILGDEMGLGKTAQVIALLQIEKNGGRVPSLVIAPATLLENWRRELALFAPTLTVLVHAGSERGGIAERLNGFDVVLASYDTAVRDEELLGQFCWNVVALDEAQAIKNPEALRTSAVKKLPRRVSIAVTGTPLENRIDDLWSLADFALPGLLGDREAFQAAFGNILEDAARLAPVVAPLLLRRKVLDVARDLPARIEVPQALQMSMPLAKSYEEVRKRALDEFGPAGGLVATTRLRMLCSHPSLLGEWGPDPCTDVPKYVRTVELLEEIFSANEKALVFSTYQGIADLMMADMPKRFPDGFFNFIDGRVEGAQRQVIVDQFFAHQGYGALFLNPKAAGSGLNITAANHVIHYNPEWNPALTAQASARSYRRKQARPVTIHHLYYLQTVEEVIRDTAAFKKDMAKEAVTGHDGGVDPLAIAHSMQVSPLNNSKGNSE